MFSFNYMLNNIVYNLLQYFASQEIINRLANKRNAIGCRLALLYLLAAGMLPSATVSRRMQFSV